MKLIPIKPCLGCGRARPLEIDSGLCVACVSFQQLLPRLPILCIDCNTPMTGAEYERHRCGRTHKKKKA